jgi:hypothetical protein
MAAGAVLSHLRLSLQDSHHFFGVALGLDLVEDVLDLAVRTDQECGSFDSQNFFAVEVFFLDDAVSVRDLLIDVGQEREWQVVLVFEFLLCLGRIVGNAQDDSVDLAESGEALAKLASLDGSTGCICFRIEI